MSLPESAYYSLAPDLRICRTLNGMWQVSGLRGQQEAQRAIAAMFQYVDAGMTTWDLADHYGPAEDLIGAFRQQWRQTRGLESLAGVQAFTKWVPRPGRMTRQVVEANIDVSLRRMDVESLDLLQFHWWEYRDLNYLEALKHMADLQAEGKIKHLALTNFDTERLQTILNAGIPIVSNQVQFSLIDRRPLVKMAEFCQTHGIRLLAYGTLCGGILSDRFMGMPEPDRSRLTTVSMRKYKPMIDEWGGWRLFQELLLVLEGIALKHGVSISNVAVRYVLEQPAVAGAIVGARLGISEHIAENSKTFDFELDADDYGKLEGVLSRSNNLFASIGDCGDEYRY